MIHLFAYVSSGPGQILFKVKWQQSESEAKAIKQIRLSLVSTRFL